MPSAWVSHVKAFYAARKKKDASYKYSSAMKDARATYKKKGASEEKQAEEPKAKPESGRCCDSIDGCLR